MKFFNIFLLQKNVEDTINLSEEDEVKRKNYEKIFRRVISNDV